MSKNERITSPPVQNTVVETLWWLLGAVLVLGLFAPLISGELSHNVVAIWSQLHHNGIIPIPPPAQVLITSADWQMIDEHLPLVKIIQNDAGQIYELFVKPSSSPSPLSTTSYATFASANSILASTSQLTLTDATFAKKNILIPWQVLQVSILGHKKTLKTAQSVLPPSTLSGNLLTVGLYQQQTLASSTATNYLQQVCVSATANCFACPPNYSPFTVAKLATISSTVWNLYACLVNSSPPSDATPNTDTGKLECDHGVFTKDCKYNVGQCTISMTPHNTGDSDTKCYKCGNVGPFCPSTNKTKVSKTHMMNVSRMATCGTDAQFSYLLTNSTHCGCSCCYSTSECGETIWTSSVVH